MSPTDNWTITGPLLDGIGSIRCGLDHDSHPDHAFPESILPFAVIGQGVPLRQNVVLSVRVLPLTRG
jgi:hypothetical protein